MKREELIRKLDDEAGMNSPKHICLALENKDLLTRLGVTSSDNQMIEDLHHHHAALHQEQKS